MRALFLPLFLVVVAGSAGASVITYTAFGDLQGASTISASDDFESYSVGTLGSPFGSQGITFSITSPATNYISNGNDLGQYADCGSQCLTANGNEIFTMSLTNGNSFTAIGFNVVTNEFAAPVVSVFGTSGLIGTYALTQAPNTLGFFGLVSDEQITSVTFTPTGGQIQNTAIDNVYIGARLASEAPEPAVGFLGSAGLLGLLAMMRRRHAQRSRA